MPRIWIAVLTSAVLSFASCEKEPSPTGPSVTTPPAGEPAKIEATPGAGAAEQAPAPGHGGAVIELGTATIDGMSVKASRDEGEIKPGGDAPIDVWIDGGLGKASAVRFWIGAEDAKGSIKAKAGVEAGHWHTHTEVPEPLPPGSKLWIEIEDDQGGRHTGAFELKN